MSQRSSIESPTPSSSLHPALQATLSSLDIQLEEELTRYRRRRGGELGRISQGRGRKRQPLEVISVGAVGGRMHPQEGRAIASVAEASTASDWNLSQQDQLRSVSSNLAIASDPLAANAEVDSVGDLQQSNLALLNRENSTKPLFDENDLSREPDDYLESSEELLKSITEEEAELRAEQGPGLIESLLTPLGIGSMLLLLLSSITFGYLVMNPSSFKFLGLEQLFGSHDAVSGIRSSAAQSENPSTRGTPDSPNLANEEFRELNLNTLSTLPKDEMALPPAASGSGMASPASLPPVSEANVTNTPAIAQPTPASQPTPIETAAIATAPATVTQPQRSSRTFPSPVARSTRRVESTAESSVGAQATSARTENSRASRAARSSSVASPSAAARTANPSQRPTSATVATAPRPAILQPAPAHNNLYYVVTNYSSDRSLEQARQVVGDAYVRNFPSGARVQLGAFSEEARAQELIQDLEHQGISAQLYQP